MVTKRNRGRKRKGGFVKDDIACHINTTGIGIQTAVPFVRCAIPKEHTLCGSIRKFVGLIWAKKRVTGTPKGAKKSIVRGPTKKFLKRGEMTKHG